MGEFDELSVQSETRVKLNSNLSSKRSSSEIKRRKLQSKNKGRVKEKTLESTTAHLIFSVADKDTSTIESQKIKLAEYEPKVGIYSPT